MVQTLRANRTSSNGANVQNTVTRAFSFTSKGIQWADAATDLDFDNAVSDTLMYRSNWTTGDLMIQGRKLGRSVDELAVMFGYQNAQSIDNIISTCQKIPIAIRRESSVLSFTHHQTVKDSGTVDEIDGWLSRAETEEWSVAALRGALQAFRNEQKKADEKAQADARAANGDAPIVNPPSANDAPGTTAPLDNAARGVATADSGTVIQGVDNRQPVITPETVAETGTGLFIPPHLAAKIRELAQFGGVTPQQLLNKMLESGIGREERTHSLSASIPALPASVAPSLQGFANLTEEEKIAKMREMAAGATEQEKADYANAMRARRLPSTVVDAPTTQRQAILDRLFTVAELSDTVQPASADDIAKMSGLAIATVNTLLTELMEVGEVVPVSGGKFALPNPQTQDALTVATLTDEEKVQSVLPAVTSAAENALKTIAAKSKLSQKETKIRLELAMSDGRVTRTKDGNYRLSTRFDNMNGG